MRREAAAILLPFLLLLPSFAVDKAADGPDGPDDVDGDLNLDDIDDVGDEGFDDDDLDGGSPGGDYPDVEDFDLGMPEEDRKKQMHACLIHTTNRVSARRDQMENTIKEIMSSPQGQQMSETQAMNTLMFSWMMSCYLNVDSAGVKQATKTGEMSDELEQEVFAPRPDRPQQVNSASQRQWELLQLVLKDEEDRHQKMQEELKRSAREQQKQQKQQQQSQPQGPPQVDVLGSGMSGQSQALYVLAVFGTLFGLGIFLVLKLSSKENAARDKRSGKNKKEGKKGK